MRIPLNKISPLIPKQASIPQFVRENYPQFIAFVKAYYEFLETSGNVIDGIFKVHSYRDIDKTLDEFLKYFYFTLMPNIPTNILADPRKLSKHIKEFYRAKGTEKSYQLLFRILYDEEISFYYPKVDLFKPSSGEWVVNTVIRTTTFNNTFAWIGQILTGVTSGATAGVENVIQFQIGSNLISEIYLSNIVGTFVLQEKVSVNGVQEDTYNLVSGVTITNPGLNYKVNDLVNIVDSDGTDAIAYIASVSGNQTGRVISAANTFIQNPGPSQVIIPPFIQLTALASNVDGFYVGFEVDIIDGPGSPETKTIIDYDGTTQIATVDSDWDIVPTVQNHYNISLGQIASIKMKNFGVGYSSNTTADFTQSGNGEATGIPIISIVATYPGQYITRDGFLSDIKKLQDSYYWQDFSYVLKTKQSLDQYAVIVKKLLHPAGTILFGEVDISTLLSLGPDFRTFERHKFKFPPYEGFVRDYPAPNENYWTPAGPTNTPEFVFADIINGEVDSAPFTRRNQVADAFIGITISQNSLPTNYEVAEYDCIEGTNSQILYDIHIGPTHNGVLGSTSGTDQNDPTWGT